MMKINPKDELIEFLNHCIERKEIAGTSCALITPLETQYFALGNKQLIPSKEENDLDTIWDVASLSKVIVTTSCILKMIEADEVSLTTSIKSILPDFIHSCVTIKQCLLHTTGLPADIANYKQMSKTEMINAAFSTPLSHSTDSQVVYSDINYILLGKVIEQIHGDIEEYASQVLFQPLQMNESGYNPCSKVINRCAAYEYIENRGGIVRGVVHDGKAFKLSGVSGHAGLFLTIQDCAKFASALLCEDLRLFKPETYALLKKCHTSDLNEKRTFGWVFSDPKYPLSDLSSECTLFHTGFSGGSILIDYTNKLAFVCLSNRVHPSREAKDFLVSRKKIHELAYKCINKTMKIGD